VAPNLPTLRPVLLGLLLAGLLLAGAALLPVGEREHRPVTTDDRTGPIAVLRAWDADRAAAWSTGDPAALRDLYTRGSSAGRSDRAMLASYVDRGLRVTGMRMQVSAVDVVRAGDDRVVLLVTDRLSAGAVVTGPDGAVSLPRDRWSTRQVELVREGGRWRVGSVTGQSADAITAAASGSSNR